MQAALDVPGDLLQGRDPSLENCDMLRGAFDFASAPHPWA